MDRRVAGVVLFTVMGAMLYLGGILLLVYAFVSPGLSMYLRVAALGGGAVSMFIGFHIAVVGADTLVSLRRGRGSG